LPEAAEEAILPLRLAVLPPVAQEVCSITELKLQKRQTARLSLLMSAQPIPLLSALAVATGMHLFLGRATLLLLVPTLPLVVGAEGTRITLSAAPGDLVADRLMERLLDKVRRTKEITAVFA